MENKLYRSDKDVVFSGVCGGLAEYFGINVTAVFYTSDGNQKTTKKSAIKIW